MADPLNDDGGLDAGARAEVSRLCQLLQLEPLEVLRQAVHSFGAKFPNTAAGEPPASSPAGKLVQENWQDLD